MIPSCKTGKGITEGRFIVIFSVMLFKCSINEASLIVIFPVMLFKCSISISSSSVLVVERINGDTLLSRFGLSFSEFPRNSLSHFWF